MKLNISTVGVQTACGLRSEGRPPIGRTQVGAYCIRLAVPSLLIFSLLLAACGDSNSNPTKPADSSTTSTVRPPTSEPTSPSSPTATGNQTTQTATIKATTAAVTTTTTPISSVVVAPNWFKDIPLYPGVEKLELDSAALGALNISTSQYYVVSSLTSDPVPTIADFYASKMTTAGWQKVEQTPIGKPEDGQRVTFTRPGGPPQNNITQFLQVFVATTELLAQLPGTTAIITKMGTGTATPTTSGPASRKVLVMLIAKPDAPDPIPVEPATSGLPTGVAAKNLTFDFGDGWVAQGQITYPAQSADAASRGAALPQPKFPTVILVQGSGLNDMDETLPEQVSGVKGGSKPFQQIAYYLPTRGFAVIRYNKRGVVGLGPQASSNTKFTNLEKPDTQYALDAAFVLNQALKNPQVDPTKVIMLGHSEGTLNVSHIAVSPDGKNVAGLVLMGVAGYDAKTIMRYQLIERDVQFLQQDADTNKDGKLTVEEFLDWANTLNPLYKNAYILGYLEATSYADSTASPTTSEPASQTSPLKYKFRTALHNEQLDKDGDGLLDIMGELKPYLEATFQMDKFPNLPNQSAEELAFYTNWQQNGSVTSVLPPYKGSVLMLNGEADTQTVVQGAREADAALAKAGNPDHTLKTYPGLGHSFYPAKGLSQPLGPIQDNVLKDLGDWLTQRYLK
ncbi:MAG: hypothetical protein HXX20_23465 [Chloroflexi bacterium]|nr:hypothetical protein [Chloroflexota bacterium]